MSKESYKARFLSKRLNRGTVFSQTVGIHPALIQRIKMLIGESDYPNMTVRSFVNNVLADHFVEHWDDVTALWDGELESFKSKIGKKQ